MWEEDVGTSFDLDDKLGFISVPRNGPKDVVQTAEFNGDGGRYTLHYRIETGD